MPEVTIVYWRDIPAQVIVGSGRRAAKMPMPERFETAIDRCAMRAGARDSDSYLAEWRKGEPYLVDGDAADVAPVNDGYLGHGAPLVNVRPSRTGGDSVRRCPGGNPAVFSSPQTSLSVRTGAS